jgi:hypothetical protein
MSASPAIKDPAALELKAAFEAVSSLTEEFTSRICPTCESVCCIDRHGTHEKADLLFLEAMGEAPPGDAPKADDTEPCRHLGPKGCTIARRMRPYRCTWYFCSALLERMPEEDPRGYRNLVAALKRLGALRQRLLEGATGAS